MRIAESMGVSPKEVYTHAYGARAKVAEFGSSSVTSAADSSKEKEGPSFVSKATGAVIALPGKILNGAWSCVKYAVYIASFGCFCKPGYSAQVLAKGLEEVRDADDPAGAWEQFKKDFPRGLDQLVELSVAKQREASLHGSDSKDPKKIAQWNEKYREECRTLFREEFEAQVVKTLEHAISNLKGQTTA